MVRLAKTLIHFLMVFTCLLRGLGRAFRLLFLHYRSLDDFGTLEIIFVPVFPVLRLEVILKHLPLQLVSPGSNFPHDVVAKLTKLRIRKAVMTG